MVRREGPWRADELDRHLICASPDHLARHGTPASPEDLKDHVCIAYTYSDSVDEWRLLDDTGKEHPATVRHIMRTNNDDTAGAAALAGLGIVRQPTFLICEDFRRKRLVPLLTGYRSPEMNVLAVYPSRRHLSAKVRCDGGFCGRGVSRHAAMGLAGAWRAALGR